MKPWETVKAVAVVILTCALCALSIAVLSAVMAAGWRIGWCLAGGA